MLAGSLCVCSGGRADQSSGGRCTAGAEEYPAVTAALWPQREGEQGHSDGGNKAWHTESDKASTPPTLTMKWLRQSKWIFSPSMTSIKENKYFLSLRSLWSAEILWRGALAVKVHIKDCLITTVVVFWFSGGQSGLYGESAQQPGRGAEERG